MNQYNLFLLIYNNSTSKMSDPPIKLWVTD